jgi:hypothetical protein
MQYLFAALLPLIAQAQGNLPKEISAVYSYQCTGNFLEGEGITPYYADCPPHQKLGFLKATHTAYLFQSESGSNLHEKLADQAYSSPICERQIARLTCNSPSKPDFGLSRQPEGIFQTRVILSPDFSANTRTYGYAAQPEPNGGCPMGLVKARFYEAQPETISDPLPSSFSNEYGSQNDRIVHLEGSRFPFFAVYRLPNTQPCDEIGSCLNSRVGAAELAQATAYEPLAGKAAFCVLPGSSIER